jgi:hypothetical protein
MGKETEMDQMSIFSALNLTRIMSSEPLFWDDDLRTLYAEKLAQMPPPRPRAALRLAGTLEALAAWLRRTVEEPAARTA